jgi:hypothetical protein
MERRTEAAALKAELRAAKARADLSNDEWREIYRLIQMGCDSSDPSVRITALDAALLRIEAVTHGAPQGATPKNSGGGTP